MGAFAWPVVTLIFSVVALLVLRSPITRLLDRAKSVGPTGLQVRDDAAVQSSAQPNALIHDLLKRFDSPLLIEAEKLIEKSLDEAKLPPTDRERLLIRHLAQAQINASFERDYNLSFGSQLIALELLNERGSNGDLLSWIQRFYSEAATREPDFYRDYSFDQWLNFIRNMQAIELDGEHIKITVYGREFLKYIVSRGLTLTKRG